MVKSSVVVTGASGFIGCRLVRELRATNSFEVIAVSRTETDKSYFHVTDYDETPSGDILIHLAEQSDRLVVNSSTNVVMIDAEKTLDCLLKKKYKKIIYCSSSVVYGDLASSPFKEEDHAEPYDTYSMMKVNNEHKVINVGGIVVRFSNVIGRGMSKNNVLSDILSQISENGPLYVQNDKPIRDFVAVHDVVAALIKLVVSGTSGVYNVGSGVGVSIKELAELALKIVLKQKTVVKSIKEITTSSYNVVDINKMKNKYNWTPQFSLQSSIEELLK